MNEPHFAGDISLIENSEGEHAIRSYVRSFAHDCAYITERFIFHWHAYETSQPVPPQQLLTEYLAHIGYKSSCIDGLRELTPARAYDILEDMLHYDLARREELVTEQEARLSVDRLREETEWAILAFTNLKRSEPSTSPLAYYGFTHVVACDNAEGGVLLVGEQDIAMIWFVDDDGPSRSVVDIRARRGSRRGDRGGPAAR
ncbi:hypothetical protein WME79_13020 [Sorangium sp. So ce726]|uniref:hypothetical protein n=1 Tax=Sorangium sp. So ce726 TaxID=3133319 RepID=UPI003F5DB799